MQRSDAVGSYPPQPVEVARVPLPTPFAMFDARAFESESGDVHLALVLGDVAGGKDVLTRVHSECLTGDALGSLRCDCGVQLRLALRVVAAEGQGVVLYSIGHEGRGIGLVNKLRAYVEQDAGADTYDANLRLELPVDSRDYGGAAAVLRTLDVQSVRLLTNNPLKAQGLLAAGMPVSSTESLATAPHARNIAYLRTKEQRLGHFEPTGEIVGRDDLGDMSPAIDTSGLTGAARPHPDRPYVVLKFAQTLDGRIATCTGDARWISSEGERRISHALRASCDAVLVGVGTVIQDDPQLTVRMVPGASPLRVALDSTLRLSDTAKILEPEASTMIITTDRSSPERRAFLQARGVRIRLVPRGPDGVDLAAALRALREEGVQTLLVEGGAKVITSMLSDRVVDRLVVGVAPTIIGRGTDAVGGLGVTRVSEGIRLTNRVMHALSDDVLLSWDVRFDPTFERKPSP
jgi:GTP cyclohydrolase II